MTGENEVTEAAGQTMWSLLEQRAAHDPTGTLLADESGRSLSAADCLRRAERVAAGLHALGVDAGTRVAWQLPTWVEAVLVSTALSRLAATQIPVIPILRRREVAHIVHETAADVLVHPHEQWRGFDYPELARAIAQEAGCALVPVGRNHAPESDPSRLPPPAREAKGEPRYIYYSSGTTAAPKGCLHTDISVQAMANGLVERYRITSEDCIPIPFAYAHIGGAIWTAAALRTGCRLLLLESFDRLESPRIIGAAGATLIGSALPFFQAYLQAQERNGATPLFPKLRSFVGGGAPKPPEIHFELKRVFGAGVLSGWGLTECTINTCSALGDSDEQLAHTEGRPSPGIDLRVVAPDGSVLPAGKEGELRVRGPQLMQGYVNPELNADAFDDAGYLRTGDLGFVDAEGFVHITGRSKDVIIRNAENISALEVENVLYRHPAVAEVALISIPDPRTGERACAVVVVKPGCAAPTVAELSAHCRAHDLSPHKHPEQVEVVAALPRNALGKVAKAELRARFVSPSTPPPVSPEGDETSTTR